MSTNLMLKGVYFLIAAVLAVVAFKMVFGVNDCRSLTEEYYETHRLDIHTPEAKKAMAIVDKTCNATGKNAEIYLKSLGLQK